MAKRPSPRAVRKILDELDVPSDVYPMDPEEPSSRESALISHAPVTAARWSRVHKAYDPLLAEEICARVEAGDNLSVICMEPHLPSYAVVTRWRRDFTEFAAAFARAREASAEACEYAALQEAQNAYDKDSAAVARVRGDALRWAASVRSPKTHGNKLDATISVEVGLADRLNAAISRVAGKVIEGQITDQSENTKRSVAAVEHDERG